MARTPKIDMDTAEKYSFLLSEFAQFKNTQSHLVTDIASTFKLSQSTILSDIGTIKAFQTTMAEDIRTTKENISGIKAVLFEKRDGKNSVCGDLDDHSSRIKSLEEQNKQKSSQSWEIKKALPTAVIIAIVNLIFFFIFYQK